MNNFILTADQDTALIAFQSFLTNPTESVFILSGYSGCGKTTLIHSILDNLVKFNKVSKLINPSHQEFTPQLCATTNKAAENLGRITGYETSTIHSFLGLRVVTNYKTNITTLVPKNHDVLTGYLLFIDEASFIDKDLL